MARDHSLATLDVLHWRCASISAWAWLCYCFSTRIWRWKCDIWHRIDCLDSTQFIVWVESARIGRLLQCGRLDLVIIWTTGSITIIRIEKVHHFQPCKPKSRFLHLLQSLFMITQSSAYDSSISWWFCSYDQGHDSTGTKLLIHEKALVVDEKFLIWYGQRLYNILNETKLQELQ